MCCSCLEMARPATGLDSSLCFVILGAQVSLNVSNVVNILAKTCQVTLYIIMCGPLLRIHYNNVPSQVIFYE